MNLVKPEFEIIEQESGEQGLYKHIERCGRTCYKSLDKITPDSAKPFVDRMIKSNHCYDGETEVLTEKGWIKWKDYNNESLAVVNTDLTFKGFENPIRVINYTYTGNFYTYPNLGITVTDGHRMFGIFRGYSNNFYNSDTYDFFTCNDEFIDSKKNRKTLGERMFKTPRCCKKDITYNPEMELLGFWLGDGCCQKSTPNKLIFHLRKQRKIQYLSQLCNDLGYKLEAGKSDYYRINIQGIGKYYADHYYKINTKFIDGFNYTPSQIRSIILGLLHSDGSISKKSATYTFSTTSYYIKDWLEKVAPIAGYHISISEIKLKNINQNTAYKIFFQTTTYSLVNDTRNPNSKCIISKDTKDVYCATVSTGLLLVRGINKVVTVCGNCAMVEHATIYLHLTMASRDQYFKYCTNKYSKANSTGSAEHGTWEGFVTTNMRVLIENGWMDDMEYLCDPTEHHERRVTVKYVASIHFYKDCTRHRVFSWAIESTRYCNYIKDKFGHSVSVIYPCWLKEEEVEEFEQDLKTIEKIYFKWIEKGWQAQQAATFLPQATKAEVIMTGFVSDFKHFFDLRALGTTGAPHPSVKELVEPLYNEFKALGYV